MGQIDYGVSDHVATIVINNPEKRNAVDPEMSTQLLDAYADVVSNDDVRVLVITGAGDKAFCAGGYIPDYVADSVVGAGATKDRTALHKPWRFYKPVIAAIDGFAVGGGFSLALYCDIRVVSTSSRMGPSGLKRGVANGATQATRLSRLVGVGNAIEILLLSKYVDGAEAHRIGLAQRLTEPGGAMAEAMDIATTIASFSPGAVQATKRLAYDNLDLGWDEALEWEEAVTKRSFHTADALEGFASFDEKRPAVFGQERSLHTLGLDEFWPGTQTPEWRK
ncbi:MULTISPECIES: enoyl-CoA hydratase/isomerase family protein [unclassified Pseudofrankia]|uniref:enoyl-CoA hydratase/isomerase family protein n=1 Tax=unclassified Pseudofrankia TaxID=2994372 RepID=UPI0008D8FF45|nr:MULTISPECIES: enoyl-CoA hydratase/isomerase family protein [unclassified Pseudofrankia]MDT3444676.1 enoyl-CoA hydratase/isomerase family protein [Pseudofrankia sp. BMG5.37]OHV66583.1 hypothetical protein BCD48_35880 [Pseudofrankia sp. BMG5.36]